MDAAIWISAATLVVIAGGAVFAGLQVREARRSREEQSRPFVVVDFDVEGGVVIYIAIENIGPSLARNVRITFTPSLASSIEDADTATAPALRDGIPTLPPRRRLRILLDTWPTREKADLPLRYDVRVEYDGPTGKPMAADEYVIDLSPLLGTRIERPSVEETLREMLGLMRQRDMRQQHAEMRDQMRQMQPQSDSGAD